MQAGIFIAFVAAATVLACGKSKETAEGPSMAELPEQPMAPQKTSDVKVTVNCLDNGGFSFEIVPWEATISATEKSITWNLYSNEYNAQKIDSVYMVPKNDATWAFDDKNIKVKKGGAVKVKLKSSAVVDRLYHYTIMVSCHGREIPIDPDMIIPR